MIMWQDIKPDIGGNGCKMQSMPILTTNTKINAYLYNLFIHVLH